jgi:predicted O-methyltransferase YrrM
MDETGRFIGIRYGPGKSRRLTDCLLAHIRAGGELLYILVRATRPATIIEFGTSYGISTLYLAAAVADNGMGSVVSTELSRAKVAAARANLIEARLSDHVEILPGDAMTTLNDIRGPVDLVLLDGWKDLCLPVLRSLESRLSAGALIVADDINLPSMNTYLEYVRNPANGYVTVAFPVDDGMEISCFAAANASGLRSAGTRTLERSGGK